MLRLLKFVHLLLEVDHDEEEYSVVLTPSKRLPNNLLAQYQTTFFPQWVSFLWKSWQENVFVVLL